MSLRRSSSRAIAVAGLNYRWTFADLGDVEEVMVQSASGQGAKLVVVLAQRGRGALVRKRNVLQEPAAITPALVARAIAFARTAGWKPAVSGSPFRIVARHDAFEVLTL